MNAPIRTVLVFATAAGAAMVGCNLPVAPGATANNASGTVCYWISTDADTYVSSDEPQRNHAHDGELVVARGGLGIKNSYVHFSIPTFPAGTKVVEAKFEIFHSGKNEDGSTDDINLNVGSMAVATWDPDTITWERRPDARSTPPSEFALRLRSQAWSGTSDVSGLAQSMIDGAETEHSLEISYSSNTASQQVEKGFYSDNDVRRQSSDLGLAPRLLLRVTLPSGSSTADVILAPFLYQHNDFGSLARPILVVKYAGSDAWPSEWNASQP